MEQHEKTRAALREKHDTRALCAEVSVVLELTEQQTIVNPGSLPSPCSGCANGLPGRARRLRRGLFESKPIPRFTSGLLKISGTFCCGRTILSSRLRAEHGRDGGTRQYRGVMEAVEAAEDTEVLYLLGIDYAQGYFFSNPWPAASWRNCCALVACPPATPASSSHSVQHRWRFNPVSTHHPGGCPDFSCM
jgi:hypothetical protein